jgi:hypothetical protein
MHQERHLFFSNKLELNFTKQPLAHPSYGMMRHSDLLRLSSTLMIIIHRSMAMTVIDTNYHRMSIKQSGTPNMDHHLKSVNLLYPGIRAINSNSPIFEIDDFLSPEQCS